MRVERITSKRNYKQEDSKKSGYPYNTQAWKRLRKVIISRDQFCVKCLEKGLYNDINDIDHIKPISAGGRVFDSNNLQGLCKSCHSQKSLRERRGGGVEF